MSEWWLYAHVCGTGWWNLVTHTPGTLDIVPEVLQPVISGYYATGVHIGLRTTRDALVAPERIGDEAAQMVGLVSLAPTKPARCRYIAGDAVIELLERAASDNPEVRESLERQIAELRGQWEPSGRDRG